MRFSTKRSLPYLVALVLVALAAVLVILKDTRFFDSRIADVDVEKSIVDKTWDNYSTEILPLAEEYGVQPEYLLALIALECSGRRIVPPRFESHVYKKLDLISRSKLNKMESVTYAEIEGMNAADLRALASSWGPFQVMGYKCFEIDATIDEMKSSKIAELSVRWITESYGDLLKLERFKDAFHVHNTGKKYPLFGPPTTYHAYYVPQGLTYMEEFRDRLLSAE